MTLSEQIEEVLLHYPTLVFDNAAQAFIGYLLVSDIDDDKYYLEIYISNFPRSFPQVWETGERIPGKADRHINQDRSCCFTTATKEELLLAVEVTSLMDFIKLILLPFLQNNSFYEIHKYYKYGEHSHNLVIATSETYREILGIKDLDLIINLLYHLITNGKVRPNELCYCNSGKKIKVCSDHQIRYKTLRKLSKNTLIRDVTKIEILSNYNSYF